MSAWGTLTGVRPVKLVQYLKQQTTGKDQVYQLLIERYGLSKPNASLIMDISEREDALLRPIDKNKVAIYLNIPFCPSRCSYCSFISVANKNAAGLYRGYVDALTLEIQAVQDFLSKHGKKVLLVYIGGGTPTVLDGDCLASLLAAVSSFNLQNALEYTVEAGRADTITEDKLEVLIRYEVNRISINPQTMNVDTLALVNRHHTPEQVIAAVELAHNKGLQVNMDMILGLPGEGVSDVQDTLQQVLNMAPVNVTVHNLALKKTSAMYQLPVPDAKQQIIAEMNAFCSRVLQKTGYYPYYLYRQKNTAGGYPNIGYTVSGQECLYNVAMISDRCSIYSCGAGSITKIISEGKRFKRLATTKDAKHYINDIDKIIEKKIRWFNDENLR